MDRAAGKPAHDALPFVQKSRLRPTHADEAARVFTWTPRPLEQVLESAFVALDTNALLVPYTVGSNSVRSIEATYQKLVDEDRLIVPGQVAREFARNRIAKIGEMAQQIDSLLSKLQVPELGKYPLLEELDSLTEVRNGLGNAESSVATCRESIKRLLADVRGIARADPILDLYGRVFVREVVADPTFDDDEFLRELDERYRDKVPPGYKDASKADGGYGDLLIWATLLHATAGKRRDLVLVSSDQKADWCHRSGGSVIEPRFELVDEYRQVSGGGRFYVIQLSRLLSDLSKAPQAIVAEVEIGESSSTGIVSEETAEMVRDGGLLFIRGQAGFGIVRPIAQLGRDDGASVRYEAWHSSEVPKNRLDLSSMTHTEGEAAERYPGPDPVVHVGPYAIAWSVRSNGSGWFYYYDPNTKYSWSREPYEMAVIQEADMSPVSLKDQVYKRRVPSSRTGVS